MKRQHMLQSGQFCASRRLVCTERSSSTNLIDSGLVISTDKNLTNSFMSAQEEEGLVNSPLIALRICRQCNKEKPETKEFFQPAKHYPKELHTYCRECRAQYFKDWRAKKDSEYIRIKAMKELYNTSIEWYESKLKEQDGHCALCEATQFTHRKRLGVDHDHSCCPKRGCGKCNRGVLCATCNYHIGQVEAVLKEATIVPKKGTWTARALEYILHYEGLRR